MNNIDRKSSLFLEELCNKACQLGALEAITINASDIVLDDRVLLKCLTPMCANYGVNLTCPPNSLSFADFKRILGKYQSVVLIRMGNTYPGKPEETKGQNSLSEIWQINKAAGSESSPSDGLTDYLQVLR